ncbi:MAG: pyrroline-5-carboxylate reductase [Clostridiales bacterium]|nr:pyrroline-5-carboxylate reductase [Clostridiales bacterium]
MNNYKISFIGGGNMAEAIFANALKNDVLKPQNTMICDIDEKRLEFISTKYKMQVTSEIELAAQFADIIIFAIKPYQYEKAIVETKSKFNNKAVISIMAGWTTRQLVDSLDLKARILRTMPNTPAMVGEGMTALCNNHTFKKEELEFATNLFSSIGKYQLIDEELLDIFIGVAGSGPAYVYMFIEALSDAGVLNGMPREMSYKFAAQTVLGAAKMVLETNAHPGDLKDMVCTPGGTTIEAVASLEKDGFRNAVINAVNKCTKKSKELSSNKQ